jgi:addiction module HigA family antidote
MSSQENKMPPIHPGEILREEFLQPAGLSQSKLARMIRVNPRRINEIVNEKRGISADTALRLATFFGNSPEFWLGLQADYDLEVAMDEAGEDIRRDVQPLEA